MLVTKGACNVKATCGARGYTGGIGVGMNREGVGCDIEGVGPDAVTGAITGAVTNVGIGVETEQ